MGIPARSMKGDSMDWINGICWFWQQKCDVDFAAWVEAGGVVLALVFGLWLARRQFRQAQKQEASRRNHVQFQRLQIIVAVLAHAKALANAMGEQLAQRHHSRIAFEAAKADVLVRQVEQLPLFDIPDPQLAIYVSELPLRLTDLKHEWQQLAAEPTTSTDNIVQAISDIRRFAGEGIERCQKLGDRISRMERRLGSERLQFLIPE